MPQHKSQRQSSYTSFYDGLPSISPSPAPTSSSDHRRSTLRRGTDTTAILEADNVTFSSDVHSSRWELCANRIILMSILFGFVLFFAGSVSFVVYVLMERSRAAEIDTSTPASLSTIITVADAYPSSMTSNVKAPFSDIVLNAVEEGR